MNRPVFLIFACLLTILIFFWLYVPTLSRYRDLKSKQEELSRQVEDLEKKVKDVREERDLLKNDVDYLEKVIREELGLVKPGEIVYKFVHDAHPATNPSIPTVEGETPGPAVPPNPTEVKKTFQPLAATSSTSQLTQNKNGAVKQAVPVASAVKPKVKKLATEPVYPRQETR